MSPLLIVIFVLGVAWAGWFAPRAARLAKEQRRSRATWFLYGAVLGPYALRILHEAPPGTCASCLSPVVGWSFRCQGCGGDVREAPELLRAMAPPVVVPTADASLSAAPLGRRKTSPQPAPSTTPRTDPLAGSATAPEQAAPAARPAHSPTELRPLTSAVFLMGSETLDPGEIYQLATYGPDLRVTGPQRPRVTHRTISRPLADIAPIALGDHLIITGRTRQLDGFFLEFASVRGGTAQSVAAELDAVREQAAAAQPPPSRRRRKATG